MARRQRSVDVCARPRPRKIGRIKHEAGHIVFCRDMSADARTALAPTFVLGANTSATVNDISPPVTGLLRTDILSPY